MRNGFLAGAVVVLTIVGTSLAEDQIRLKSRRFVPSRGITAGAKTKIEAARPRGEPARVIIQLDRKMTRPYRKSLEAQGLNLLGYIPQRAWLAAIDPSKDVDIMKIEGVRAVCEILPQDKIAPSIRKYGINNTSLIAPDKAKLVVMFFEDVSFSEVEPVVSGYGGRILGRTNLLHGLTVQLEIADIWDLAAEDCVRWIDQHYEIVPLNDGTRQAVGANAVQDIGLSGEGVIIGMWDSGYADADHNDLSGRVTIPDANSWDDDHATHVAGTMIGDGSIDPKYKGMAPDAEVVSYFNGKIHYDPCQVEQDYNEAINEYNIDLSNNSWGRLAVRKPPPSGGRDLDSTYDWDAELYDQIVKGAFEKKISIVFATGNDGDGQPSPWTSLMPNAVAKNVIAVGASNSSDNSIAPFSSRGPTADGRVKPDLVAPGTDGSMVDDCYSKSCDPNDPNDSCCPADPSEYIWSCWPDPEDSYAGMTGTSCAAPVVSGCIALMIEKWRDDCSDADYLPLPSTIKAVLIETAFDLTSTEDPCCTAGPDYSSGWGRVDVNSAIELIDADGNDGNIIIEDSILDTDDSDVFKVNVPSGQSELKITLVWDDYPGEPHPT